jgi:dipeptidyl-peptidase-3
VQADAELAQKFMNSKVFYINKKISKDEKKQGLSFQDLSAYNTRLFKFTENGKVIYEVRLASSLTKASGIVISIL